MVKYERNKGITLIALIVTIIVLLILAGVTISQLNGSDSAPAKANESNQKNDIGAAKDDISLAVVNAKMQGMENAYVENGVSKAEASTTVGQTVINSVLEKNGTNMGKATINVEQTEENGVKGNASISIYTTDFVVDGTITIQDGILTWGEIEPNVPRISGVPEALSIDTGSNYTINAKLKGTTGNISWSSNKPSIASVSNGVITTALSIANPTEQVTITASADGCESKTCILTVTKAMPLAKNLLIVTVENEGTENETVTSEKYVNYPMSNGKTIKCRVLYNDEQHGLQIIPVQWATNTSNQAIFVKLGRTDKNASDVEQIQLNSNLTYNDTNLKSNCTKSEYIKAKNSYNNMIQTLNMASYELRNENLSEYARCVGSNAVGIPVGQPISNPTIDSGLYVTNEDKGIAPYNQIYQENYGIFSDEYKKEDTNYEEDQKRLTKIGAWNIGQTYWLASRYVQATYNATSFKARYVYNYNDGPIYSYSLCWIGRDGNANANDGPDVPSNEHRLRPIFYLKSGVKILGGQGTSDSPYELFAE